MKIDVRKKAKQWRETSFGQQGSRTRKSPAADPTMPPTLPSTVLKYPSIFCDPLAGDLPLPIYFF